jgi:hypothetical protein
LWPAIAETEALLRRGRLRERSPNVDVLQVS